MPLPKLRATLDAIPSPLPGRPGLLLRDPLGYADETIVVPPEWVPVLACLDGEHDERDAQLILTRQRGGRLAFVDEIRAFVRALAEGGFLETEELERRRRARQEAFRAAPVREAAHAGSAYPAARDELLAALDARFGDADDAGGASDGALCGIVAPHVSPAGGDPCYREAYRRVRPAHTNRTFVILGTSHYGAPERFGVTAKPFVTPLGRAEVDRDALATLVARAPQAIVEEDDCHAVEHSIELQVVFLQYRWGSPVRILPILCGPFVEALRTGRAPEADGAVGAFFDALAELAAARGEELFWVLGVDLAHVGLRYGDGRPARAGRGAMEAVAAEDRRRLERFAAGDAQGLLESVAAEGDPLRWCGFPPLYTFVRALGETLRPRAELLRYEQWNIDPDSVVSFAALTLLAAREGGPAP